MLMCYTLQTERLPFKILVRFVKLVCWYKKFYRQKDKKLAEVYEKIQYSDENYGTFTVL